jgi:hypothetical protein
VEGPELEGDEVGLVGIMVGAKVGADVDMVGALVGALVGAVVGAVVPEEPKAKQEERSSWICGGKVIETVPAL